MRAVLRRVDSLLVDQARRNAAGSLAQVEATRRDDDRALADLGRFEAERRPAGL